MSFARLPQSRLRSRAPGPWPANLACTEGKLTLAGHALSDLAVHGTPVYLVDEDDMRSRARAWVDAIGDGDVYYAGKSFLSPLLARWMVEEGLYIDTASEGELRTALAGGVPKDWTARQFEVRCSS